MKIKPEEITSLRSNMFTKESWITVRTKKKDLKCSNCGSLHAEDDCGITLAMVTKKPNAHFCKACTEYYIANGVEDMAVKIKANNDEKEVYQKGIMEMDSKYSMKDSNRKYFASENNLSKRSLEDLKVLYAHLLTKKLKAERIEKETQENFVDTPTEDYLLKIPNFYEDKEFLKHPEHIESWICEDTSEYFESGQGIYPNDANIICKIGNKYYEVSIIPEICSSKQDHGDRLYWVESIESVTYKEIEKPSRAVINISKEQMFDYLMSNCYEELKYNLASVLGVPTYKISDKKAGINALKDVIRNKI